MGATTRGYPYPEPTDLVTDGAAAMEALAEAVNADVAAQVAAIATEAANRAAGDALAIVKSLLDAKGDLIAATANDTPARLGLGTNGQVLTVDTTTATGLKYATPASGGSMINQTIRGTIAMTSATGDTSKNATIATVNMAKTQLRNLGSDTNSVASTNDSSTFCRLALTATTTVNCTRVSGNTNVNVNYELTEWT